MTNQPFDEEKTRKLYDEFIKEHPEADIPWESALKAARMAHEELSKNKWGDPEQIINNIAHKVVSEIDYSVWLK